MEVVKQRNPRWYKSLADSNIGNIVLFPLKARSGLLGYVLALNYSPEHALKIKETLEVATFILASEIANYLMLDQLKVLSSRDMLTGVLNRNEMNNVVEALSNGKQGAGKSIGVVFADLNGLKIANDVGGHNAGDRVLRNAAAALQDVFESNRIFRAGGDEFTVIISDTTEDELLEKAGELREAAQRYDDVSFSIGTCIKADGTDVREALKIADARMYEDKRAYYAAHPEKRRPTPKDEYRDQAE